jgi:SAM-dependent methyltransferase
MGDSDGSFDSLPSEQVDRFNAMYDAGPPPWDIGRPQPAFLQLAESGALSGRVLDVGCGTGEHALMAAAYGLDATGIDAVPRAINLAQRKAQDRGLKARFLVWDALRLPDLGEQFDTVLDSGLFHVFDDEDRARFVASLAAVIPTGGHYYMLCFSDRQPGTFGPRRVSRAEIEDAFGLPEWHIEAIDAATMDTKTMDANMDDIVQAWRASITRR